MPPGRKPTHSPEEFVGSAVAYADEHGLDALTLRGLGKAMGVSATAIYRYFADKESLVVAMREALLTRVFTGERAGTPEQIIVTIALDYRAVARQHPCLSQIMAVRVDRGDTSLAVPMIVGQHLRAMGVHGHAAALAYRQLESFVVGVTAIDFTNAPHHLDERRDRMRLAQPADVSLGQDTSDDVDRLNEEAFEASLRALVASFSARPSQRE